MNHLLAFEAPDDVHNNWFDNSVLSKGDVLEFFVDEVVRKDGTTTVFINARKKESVYVPTQSY